MTGGRVVILGETGRNFGAGMSGGIAYIYDPENAFPARCNMGMVGLERVDTAEEKTLLASYVKDHHEATQSQVAEAMLKDWDNTVGKFVKVMPHDFKRVLLAAAAEKNP